MYLNECNISAASYGSKHSHVKLIQPGFNATLSHSNDMCDQQKRYLFSHNSYNTFKPKRSYRLVKPFVWVLIKNGWVNKAKKENINMKGYGDCVERSAIDYWGIMYNTI